MQLCPLTCLTMFLVCAGCAGDNDATERAVAPTQVPTSTACADAPQLRQRAADDRLRVADVSSQQTQTIRGAQANFFASLAAVAQLQCAVTLADEEPALHAALQAAHNAEGASGFYEQALRWDEANYALTRVIDSLAQRLSAPVPE